MSIIEDLVWSAHEHGKREDLFAKVSELKAEFPRLKLEELYEKAYQEVLNTWLNGYLTRLGTELIGLRCLHMGL